MKRKIILGMTLFLMLLMLFALSVSAKTPLTSFDASKTSNDNVTVNIYKENGYGVYSITITGTGEMKGWANDFNVPWRYYYSSGAKSVTIEEGVTSIGAYALSGCSSITSIELPDSLNSIGDNAFSGCAKLTSIVIPEGVTTIGENAFYGCSKLTSIELPESVTYIGSYAFRDCTSLTSIVIPEGVTTIGYYAFYGCTKLTIYCEAESQPNGWNPYWNSSSCPVVWGYFDEYACLNSIFTFKGYSFSANGGFAVGFAIDYDALAKYEAKTGKKLEIGVVFAGYENLGGKQPLDEAGKGVSLEVGMVKKADVTSLGYKYYDFMLSDIDDSIKDVKLVIAGYIFNGDSVQYVQEKGLSHTVEGVSYNEALN